MTDKPKASEHDLREGSKLEVKEQELLKLAKAAQEPKCDECGAGVGRPKCPLELPPNECPRLEPAIRWRENRRKFTDAALTQLTAILEENQRLAKDLSAAEQRILDHCCGKAPICCGDAHQELEWNLRVMTDCGLEQEVMQGKTFKEIVWRNKRAEAAEGRLEKMREALKGMVKRLRAMGMVNSAEICEAVLAE